MASIGQLHTIQGYVLNLFHGIATYNSSQIMMILERTVEVELRASLGHKQRKVIINVFRLISGI